MICRSSAADHEQRIISKTTSVSVNTCFMTGLRIPEKAGQVERPSYRHHDCKKENCDDSAQKVWAGRPAMTLVSLCCSGKSRLGVVLISRKKTGAACSRSTLTQRPASQCEDGSRESTMNTAASRLRVHIAGQCTSAKDDPLDEPQKQGRRGRASSPRIWVAVTMITTMTHSPFDIPELTDLTAGGGLIRVPVECNVPFTPRVRAIVDTVEFQRLSQISQLGLVAKVYPGARHTRFEHALGVYHNALRYLAQLRQDDRFCELIGQHKAELLIVTALLHDLGHWPFCHPIEDLEIEGIKDHEAYAAQFSLR